MNNREWMNEEIREEIEALRESHGLVEDEAVAFWHLSEARRLMVALTIEDKDKVRKAREKEYETLDGHAYAGRQIGDEIHFGAASQTDISQHFDALNAQLAHRVLRRSYPEWDWELSEAEAGEVDNGG